MSELYDKAKLRAIREITVGQSFETYMKACYPTVERDSTQFDVMKTVFYSSFMECLMIVTEISSTLTEDEAAKKLDQFVQETKAYHYETLKKAERAMREGRAP